MALLTLCTLLLCIKRLNAMPPSNPVNGTVLKTRRFPERTMKHPFTTLNTTMNDRSRRPLNMEGTLSRVVFYAMSDGPEGSNARKQFPRVLQRLESRPEFLVHLGDVHERQKDCTLSHFDTTADNFLEHVNIPTFVVPGDADWYECNDKAAAWNKWQDRFSSFHLNWEPLPFDVKQQDARQENFAFNYKGVLFVGLHVLDATVRDWDTWHEIVHDDAVWLQEQLDASALDDNIGAIVLFCHAYAHPRRYHEFYNVLVDKAKDIGKPVLYLQGDTHSFVVDRRFPVPNMLRVVVDQLDDPLEVQVDPYGAVPFKLNRRRRVTR